MRKGMHKLMYILGTTLILLGTLMSTVMSVVQASTVTGVSSSLTSSVTTSSKDDSNSSKNVVSSSKSSTTPIENESSVSVTSSKNSSNESSIHSQASSESSSSQVASSNSSSKAESSATSRRAQNLAATASSTPTAQKIGETNIRTLDAGTDGAYGHFRTADGDVTYCYNWQWSTPDKINGTKYNQYQFYDGLKDVTGDQQKVAKVAAALEAGYHKDADTGKYNVAPQFQDLAQSSFEDTVASSEYRGFIPSSNYTLSQYEEDVTQSVIWYLDGAPDTITTDAQGQVMQPGYMATHTALGRAILSYAQNHPLDKETAYPKNVAVKDANGTVNDSHPLVMDSQTKMSQPFQLTGYNGGVQITDLPKGYEIVDENGNKVTQVESGKNYRVKYVGSGNPSDTTANNTVNKIQAKANYESLKDSNYFSAQLKNDPLTNNPYQNMVNLTTTENSFLFPIVWQTSSSSSSSSSVSSNSKSASSSMKSQSSKSSSMNSNSKSSSSMKSQSSKSSSMNSNSKSSSSMKSTSSKSSSMNANSKSSSSMKSTSSKSSSIENSNSKSSSVKTNSKSSSIASSSNKNTNSSSENNGSKNTSSTNGAVNDESSSTVRGVVAGNGSGNESGKGNGQGQGEGNGTGHGMPQTGEAIPTAIIAGVILVATAGMITLKKRN